MNRRIPKFPLCQTVIALALSGLAPAFAGVTINGPGDSYLSLGIGLRTSFTSEEDGAPSGRDRSSDFNVDSVRLFSSAQIVKGVKAVFNTERKADETMRVLDAMAQFEFSPYFNVWMGRFLPPSDRANLAGPYFANAWEYPGVASAYPARFAGRDDGAVFWGKAADDKFVYSFGAFNGKNRKAGASNDSSEPLFAGRVAYAFLDAEPAPAYYVGNTYYGSNDIFTVGAAFMSQKDGVGTALAKGDYRSWNIDALFEKKIAGGGALTLEGAYYDYDTDGVSDTSLAVIAACGGQDNCGGAVEGKSYLATAAFLIPGKVGMGQFQPFVRYQKFNPEASASTDIDRYDLGVHYVIAGHNARISAVYSDTDTGPTKTNKFVLGVQLMY